MSNKGKLAQDLKYPSVVQENDEDGLDQNGQYWKWRDLKLFQETFRSLEADELDMEKEGKRLIPQFFGLNNMKEEQDWLGEEKMEFCFGHIKFQIPV